MFEFGKDLRKLFGQARESDDLSWTELIGVDLLASEARRQTTDAGRVSCARPHRAWVMASGMWREHARRTGDAGSLDRSLEAATDAAKAARSPGETARAAVARAETLLVRYDLCGGAVRLDAAVEAVPRVGSGCDRATAAQIAAIHARVTARKARLAETPEASANASALLDVALHLIQGRPSSETDDLRMDRAGLALEAGIARRDVRQLDQAGRDLQALVETASPDYRPLTRARALTLCGAGLVALGALASDPAAQDQGHALFEAAAEQFTPDHSPLDWATIVVVRSGSAGGTSLASLRQAEALTDGHDLIVGAMARDLRIEAEIGLAVTHRDTAALAAIETAVRRRLADRTRRQTDLAWAVDQIAMARLGRARERLASRRPLDRGSESFGLALMEASEVAREHGATVLSNRAESLMSVAAQKA